MSDVTKIAGEINDILNSIAAAYPGDIQPGEFTARDVEKLRPDVKPWRIRDDLQTRERAGELLVREVVHDGMRCKAYRKA